MEEVRTDSVDKMRVAGLYLGPVILGAVAGNGLYGAACGAPTFVLGVSDRPLALTLPFVIGGIILAWRMKEPLGRVAMLLFAVHNAILVYGSITGVRLNSVITTTSITAFAALLTASGGRDGTTRQLVMAASVFVAMLVFSVGARHYADALLGHHTVVNSSPIC